MSINGVSTGVVMWSIGQEGPQPAKLTIKGRDNYKKPKQEFADRLAAYSDRELQNVAEEYIWLSAFAANNPDSDYHWMCDATYDECVRRDSVYLYDSAWHRASGM